METGRPLAVGPPTLGLSHAGTRQPQPAVTRASPKQVPGCFPPGLPWMGRKVSPLAPVTQQRGRPLG